MPSLHSAGYSLWLALSSRRRRVQLYLALGVLSFALAVTALLLRPHFQFTFVVSDARGYYAWLPSAFIDHDLDLRNQLAPRDPTEEAYTDTTPLGRINDRYPIGVSLTLVPEFVVAHAVSRVAYGVSNQEVFKPDGYSVVYQLLASAFVIALAVVAMLMVDGIGVNGLGIDPRAIGLAVFLYWTGSPWFFYVVRQPVMAHVIGAFWVICSIWLFEAIRRRWASGQPAIWATSAFGLCAGMAVITRPTNATLVVFGAYLVWIGLVRPVGSRRADTALLAFCALPLFAQMWVWHRVSGSYLYYSYLDEVFDWRHPKLVQTLFSSFHGLLFWTPLIALSLLGLAQRDARRKTIITLGLLALAALWIVNSSWDWWWFGGAFGGRAFLDLSIFFILGLALYLERQSQSGRRAFTHTIVVASTCVVYSWILLLLFVSKRIPNQDYLLPWF